MSNNKLTIVRDSSLNDFVNNVHPLLYKNEDTNNFILGWLDKIINSDVKLNCTTNLIRIMNSTQTIAAAMQVEKSNLVITSATSQQIEYLAVYLDAIDLKFPGVYAERKVAEEFSNHWPRLSNKTPIFAMEQILYKIEQVNFFRMPGHIRVPKTHEVDLLAQWIVNFSEEAQLSADRKTFEEAQLLVHQAIKKTAVYVLDVNQQPVSVAILNRSTLNGISIGPVYTPKSSRKNGYGSAIVAHLSKKALDAGKKFCVLYTDAKNATSNKIYQKIGYKKIEDWGVIYFDSY